MMQQLVLDIGLPTGPVLGNYLPGPTPPHCATWFSGWVMPHPRSAPLRVPGADPLVGPSGSGKESFAQGPARSGLRSQGARVGWLDASVLEPPPLMSPGRRC